MTRRKVGALVMRPETIDPLTGEPAPRGAPEAIATGRTVANIRTPTGAHVRLHIADDDARYLVLRRRASAPLSRAHAPPKIGATFASTEAAIREFVGRNDWFFESASLESVDPVDLVRDWLDGIDTAVGKRHARAVDTRAGRRILALSRNPPRMIIAAIRYIFGRAKGRRWRNVDWRDVDALTSAVHEQMVDYSERSEVPAPAGVWWYPVGSGLVERDDLVEQAVEDLGPRRAHALLRWMTSQDLWDLVERGKAAIERGRECLGIAEGRAARRRLAVMRRWAARPELMPDWACVPSTRLDTQGLCLVPALAAEIADLESACERDYDPTRARESHAAACSSGRGTWGTGLAPCGHELSDEQLDPLAPIEPIEPIDEIPW